VPEKQLNAANSGGLPPVSVQLIGHLAPPPCEFEQVLLDIGVASPCRAVFAFARVGAVLVCPGEHGGHLSLYGSCPTEPAKIGCALALTLGACLRSRAPVGR
jgi:hypothetical protein